MRLEPNYIYQPEFLSTRTIAQTNLNTNTSPGQIVLWNTTTTFINTIRGASLDGAGVITLPEGQYEISANIYGTGFSARMSVGLQVNVNAILTGNRGASGYIRNINGHNEASTSVHDVYDLTNATNTVEIRGYREANTGTYFSTAGAGSLIVRRLR